MYWISQPAIDSFLWINWENIKEREFSNVFETILSSVEIQSVELWFRPKILIVHSVYASWAFEHLEGRSFITEDENQNIIAAWLKHDNVEWKINPNDAHIEIYRDFTRKNRMNVSFTETGFILNKSWTWTIDIKLNILAFW